MQQEENQNLNRQRESLFKKYIFYILIIILAALQFAHYPFSGEMAWEVGWSSHDLMILLLLLAWAGSLNIKKNAKLLTLIIVLVIWRFYILFANLNVWI